jgi:outer membrane protein OmpU
MKQVLFTTTALVAFSGAAMADVTWSGSASLGYNDGAGELAEGINSDIDLDVTMSNGGGYSATVSAAMEGGSSITGEDIDITTPVVSIHYGEVVEAANSAYSDTDGLSGLGSDEFTSADGSGAALLVTASTGGMTVGFSDDATVDGSESSFGISGDLGGLSFGIGSKDEDWGISASGSALGGTISVASEEVDGTAGTGVSMTLPLGDMSLTVSATDGDFWGASVSTSLAGASISAGTDSNDDTQFGISTTLAGGFGLAADYDTDNGTELALSYSLSDSATLTVSYNEDLDEDNDDDNESGTEAKIAFSF